MSRIQRAALLFLVLAILPGTVLGQSFRGTILGTVRDSTRAVMPGVTVTVTNTGTNIGRTAVTNEEGFYVFPELPI